MPPVERIGVFGGTFDPPHVGHLVAAVNVRYQLDLDVVLLVVANQPWQKLGDRPITPAGDRLAMVAAAAAGVAGVAVSGLEIDRGGITYSVDTLATLHGQNPAAELFLIVGSDVAAGLTTWERIDEVRALASIVEVTRSGDRPKGEVPGIRHRVEIPRIEVSSTDVRQRVASGAPIDFLVPSPAASYIADHGLYGGELL